MFRDIPRLEDYELSRIHGFLPESPPVRRLASAYYEPWEKIMSKFSSFLFTGRLRQCIQSMPVLSPAFLNGQAEKRRAFLILSFMGHGYIWGGRKPADILPAAIAVPWTQVANELGMKPVICHSAVCLWNYDLLYEEGPIDFDNISTQFTFTGSQDESWFYLISTVIEWKGAKSLSLILEAIKAARLNDPSTFVRCLQGFAVILNDLCEVLSRMPEKNDPHYFYTKIRPWLAGGKNMEQVGLPDGVYYEGCPSEDDPNGSWNKFSGGSNAQSALIQAFDIALGVEHYPTGEKAPDTKQRRVSMSQASSPPKTRGHSFLKEMRDYMPKTHRDFLSHLVQVSNIRDYAFDHKDGYDGLVGRAYDSCLSLLYDFRNRHMQIVSRYIIIPAANARKTKESVQEQEPKQNSAVGLGKVATQDQSRLTGTGGTNLTAFLRQARNETGEKLIESWRKEAFSEIPLEAWTEAPACRSGEHGLAGRWSVNETSGGLCNY